MQLHIGAWAADFDDEGILWVSDFTYNGLYRYDLEKRKLEFVHRFERISISKASLHKEMRVIGNEIFLFPLRDNKIRIFNKKTSKESYIDLPPGHGNRFDVWVGEKKALIFSDDNNSDILCFDFETRTISSDVKLNELCMKLIGKKDWTVKKGSYNNTLIVLDNDTQKVYCIDTDTYQYKIIDVKPIKEGIEKICFFKRKYWFLLRESHDIVAYDIDMKIYIRYKAETTEYIENRKFIPYSNIVQWENELIILNYYGKDVMRIVEKKQTIEKLFSKELEIVPRQDIEYGACYMTAINRDKKMYLIPHRAEAIIEINKDLEISNQYECLIDKDEKELQRILLSKQKDKSIMKENKTIATLQRYITNIFQSQYSEVDCDVGRKIYLKLNTEVEE